jgi:indolepyruvate ferredoxin oxidoreductase alpha subunit
MDRSHPQDWERRSVIVNEKCEGCAFCIKHFECPALEFQGEGQPIRINAGLCSGCGVCVHVCPHGALQVEPRK